MYELEKNFNTMLEKGNFVSTPQHDQAKMRASVQSLLNSTAVESNMAKYEEPMTLRTAWLSDIHLGFRGCQADALLDFLHSTRLDTLYLVGDIIDVWSLKRKFYWPQAHNNVIRTILGKAKHGTKVVYIPGNHDEVFREYDGMVFGNVSIKRQAIHETADGKRLLMLHGDEFDSIVLTGSWLESLGNYSYDFLLKLNRYFNNIRKWFGLPYWSLAGYLKHKVKNAVSFISSFEEAVARSAKQHEVDGVVCGHIHHAEIRDIDGITYYNDGDWVESCTAMVEDHDGNIEIINWVEHMQNREHHQDNPMPEKMAA